MKSFENDVSSELIPIVLRLVERYPTEDVRRVLASFAKALQDDPEIWNRPLIL